MEKLLKLLLKIRAKIEKIIGIFSWKNLKNILFEQSEDEETIPLKSLFQKEIEGRRIAEGSKNNKNFEAKILGKFSPRDFDNSLQIFEQTFSQNLSKKLQKIGNAGRGFRGESGEISKEKVWRESGEKFRQNHPPILEIWTKNFSPQVKNFSILPNKNLPPQDKNLTTLSNFLRGFQPDFFDENPLRNFNKISTLNNFFNDINFNPSGQNFDVENSTPTEVANSENTNLTSQISAQKSENFTSVFQNRAEENPKFYADDFREIVANIVGDFVDTSLRINGFKVQ